MTSEVVILNKKGLVLAADSAVTTGMSNGNHPRYSKAANKIFDISALGNIAVTIFGSADLDRVPWEVALKRFRATHSGEAMLPAVADYVSALIEFLRTDSALFPSAFLDSLKTERLREAMIHVLKEANHVAPGLLDETKTDAERVPAFSVAF